MVLRERADLTPRRLAIKDGVTTFTYSQLYKLARAVAKGLIGQCEVVVGEHVGIWAPNGWQWIVAACGIHMVGAVIVPFSTRMRRAEIVGQLNRSQVRTLFATGHFLHRYYPDDIRGGDIRGLRRVVVMEPDIELESSSWKQLLWRGHTISDASVDERMKQVRADAASDLLFTSGTTGIPKGVVTTHSAAVRAFKAWGDGVGLQDAEKYLIVNPFFRTFGLKAGLYASLLFGATMYPLAVFGVPSVMKIVESERITFLPGPPTLFIKLLQAGIDKGDMVSVRGAVTGAATISPRLISDIHNRLGVERVTTAYGLTECGGCATVTSWRDDPETIATTCGRPIPDTELRCVDVHNEVVETGQHGEIVLRGYHVMKEYYRDPISTANVIDAGGWLHTGDAGYVDNDGRLHVTDRIKNMFTVGGFNCYPAEVERLLMRNQDIEQVIVVGVENSLMGEVGYAYVKARAGARIVKSILKEWARNEMSNYKVPRYWELIQEFPLNDSGKVKRAILRERARVAVKKQRPGSV